MINLAQHLDIDGIVPEDNSPGAHSDYIQMVDQAKGLVRKLEAAMQAVYDDAASLLLSAQSLPTPYPPLPTLAHNPLGILTALIPSIKRNLAVVTNALESMLSMGHDQAEIEQSTYRNSIEWRRSRLSLIGTSLDPIQPPHSGSMEDVVDMELAFSRPGMRTMAPANADAAESSALYHNGGAQYAKTQTSLNTSDRSRSEGAPEPLTPTWPPPETPDSSTVVVSQSPDDMSLNDDHSELFDDDIREYSIHLRQ